MNSATMTSTASTAIAKSHLSLVMRRSVAHLLTVHPADYNVEHMYLPSSEEIAWTAGFLEGEGCFRLDSNSPRVSASQKEREPLERLQGLWGGSILETKPRNGYPFRQWQLGSKPALLLMEALRPHMSSRRRGQIDSAMAVVPGLVRLNHANRKKTHCKRGHSFDTENTHINKKGARRCRACNRDYMRRRSLSVRFATTDRTDGPQTRDPSQTGQCSDRAGVWGTH